MAAERADARFNPSVFKKKSNKIDGPDRLLWVKASVAADSPVIIGGAAASAPRSLGQLPNATRHQRTATQAANSKMVNKGEGETAKLQGGNIHPATPLLRNAQRVEVKHTGQRTNWTQQQQQQPFCPTSQTGITD